MNVCSSTSSDEIPSPNSLRRCSSVAHSIGDWSPAGGGTCFAMVRKRSPMKPSGVQPTSAIVPPGRVTRSSSAAACSWFGANIEPKTLRTASNDASGKGSASASPSRNSTSRPSAAARCRPRSRSDGT